MRPREGSRGNAQKPQQGQAPQKARSPEDEAKRREEMDARRAKAIDLAITTLDALLDERGDAGRIWSSMLKQAIKRRQPGFNETYYGFKTFGNLMEELQTRGLIELGRDDKGGPFVQRRLAGKPGNDEPVVVAPVPEIAPAPVTESPLAPTEANADSPAAESAAETPVDVKPESAGRPRRSRGQRSRSKATSAAKGEAEPAQAPAPAAEKKPAKPRAPRRTKKAAES